MKLRIIKNKAGYYRVEKQSNIGVWVALKSFHFLDNHDEGLVFETRNWDAAVQRVDDEGTAARRARDRNNWSLVQYFEYDEDGFEQRKT